MSENLKQHFFPFGEKEPQIQEKPLYEDDYYDTRSSSASSYSEVELDVKNSSENDKTLNCNEDEMYILIKECDICTSDVTIDEMFSPMFCQHSFCKSCAIRHYEVQIKNFGIQNVVCPFPSCTDVLILEPQQQHEYFSLTKFQLEEILDKDTMNIFERKLLDWGLSSASNFIWCPKCENGMFADNDGEEFIHCNNCNCSVCPNCKQEWTKEHTDRSCEEYTLWKELNNPEKQDQQLQKYLEKYGIECPECHNKFIRPSGGCLHLKCPMQMCQHEFCEGCLKTFKNGKVIP